MKKIRIKTKQTTPRLEYCCKFMFMDFFDFPCEISEEGSKSSDKDFIINYSEEEKKDGFSVFPAGLLSESIIQKHDIRIGELENMSYIFGTQKGDFPFDIFSAVFYMISRYEEYLSSEKDRYGRFRAENSLVVRLGDPLLPVVNVWLREFADRLMKYYPGLQLAMPGPVFKPGIDIDNPWLYRNKPAYRILGGGSKELLRLDFSALRKRTNSLWGKHKDPYDSYDQIIENHKPGLSIFYLMGDRHPKDNKIRAGNRQWQEIIKKLDRQFETGMHPSFRGSTQNRALWKEEKRLLEDITGKKIFRSRQHYLLLDIPSTYRNLISLGIKEDYSMGFAEIAGYRAGTNVAFRFYDLEKEEATSLRIFPFALMDRSLKDYMKKSPDEAILIIEKACDYVISFGGNLISVWHNESLGDSAEWEGWDEVYSFLLKKGYILNRKK